VHTCLPKSNPATLNRSKEEPPYIRDSVKNVQRFGLWADEIVEYSWWKDYLFPEHSAKVLDLHGNIAVFDERIQAWCSTEESASWFGAHYSARGDPSYASSRHELLKARGACFKTECFACSSVEYSSSSVLNSSIKTRDQFYIPLGFRKGEKVMCACLPLERECSVFDIMHEVSCTVVEDNMKRFRDICNIVKARDIFFVLERYRGRIS